MLDGINKTKIIERPKKEEIKTEQEMMQELMNIRVFGVPIFIIIVTILALAFLYIYLT